MFLDSISFIFILIFIISFLLLILGFVCCSFSSSFKCKVRLFELFLVFWDRPVMLWIFLLGLLSLCPADLGLLCSHSHLFQGIFGSSLISLLTHSLFNTILFSFHVLVCFSVFFLWSFYETSSFIVVWSEKMLDRISILLNVSRHFCILTCGLS